MVADPELFWARYGGIVARATFPNFVEYYRARPTIQSIYTDLGGFGCRLASARQYLRNWGLVSGAVKSSIRFACFVCHRPDNCR